jgi:hypothetical protein
MAMNPKSDARTSKIPQQASSWVRAEGRELSSEELDRVSGGLKKLPGKRKPPTLTLKRG